MREPIDYQGDNEMTDENETTVVETSEEYLDTTDEPMSAQTMITIVATAAAGTYLVKRLYRRFKKTEVTTEVAVIDTTSKEA